MAKRGLGLLWVALLVLLGLVSTAMAQVPVDVCWRPPGLPANVDTFAVIKDRKGGTVVILEAHEFWEEARDRVVLRYNPNLGADSLARIPSGARPAKCTPPPPKKPNAPKTTAPAPPAPPAPPPAPKKNDDAEKAKPPQAAEELAKKKEEERRRWDGRGPPVGGQPLPKEKDGGVLSDHYEPPKDAQNDPNSPVEYKGGFLPQVKPGKLLSVLSCEQTKEGCKEKTGDEKGPVKDRTAAEEAREEAALLAGILDSRLDEDLNQAGASKNGVIGGRNPNGIDHPVAQVVAVAVQITLSVVGLPGREFIKKIKEAAKKNVPLIIKEADDEAIKMAQALAKTHGLKIAAALQQVRAIGPHKFMKEFTEGLGGRLEAHHILEAKWNMELGFGKHELFPTAILTREEHQAISNAFTKAYADLAKPIKTRKQLWEIYKTVYKDRPLWLDVLKKYSE